MAKSTSLISACDAPPAGLTGRARCVVTTSGFSFHVGSAKFALFQQTPDRPPFGTVGRSVRKCEARASRVKGRRMYAVDPEDAAPRPPPPHAPLTRATGATEHTYHIHGAVTKRCDS